jgi:TetR/AcrR family transcriptional regulator, transcriptional repressor for nem operon
MVAGYGASEMTDSTLSKRERLVEGACRVLLEQGVNATTIADIAAAADVPAGNVYYYFKTKDELIEAVIDAHADHIQAVLADFERHRTPRARLKAMAMSWPEMAEQVARHGCPHGTICQELAKRDDVLGRRATKLMAMAIDWAEEQFRLMGARDARDLAVGLVAAIQGTALLTSTFHDPELMTRQAHRLARSIDELADRRGR